MKNLRNIVLGVFVPFLILQQNAYALFENKTIDENSTGAGTEIIETILFFANVLAGLVLAVSIVAMIYAASHFLGWKLEKGVGWSRTSKQRMMLMHSGIGIIISLSAFAILRLFAGFSV